MSGICGVIAQQDGFPISQPLLSMMNNSMRISGQSEAGYYIDDQAGLAIQQPKNASHPSDQQPIPNEDRSLWLLFSGEIYNYQLLRTAFEKQGHQFATSLNGEVLLHAYEVYGDDCLQYLNGKFAFALWDAKHRRLLLGRDRMGLLPLYYYASPNNFIFGTELKAVMVHPDSKPTINLYGLDSFLTFEYIPSPMTIFADVYKLPAGHCLVWENGRFKINQYWNISPVLVPKDDAAAVEQFETLIKDAITIRQPSRGDTAILLSGGLYSSALGHWANEQAVGNIKTVSTQFGFEEKKRARLPQFESRHYQESVNINVADQIGRAVCGMDEPFADFSLLPMALLMHTAEKHSRVALMGSGANIIFAGRDAYLAQKLDDVIYGRISPWLRKTTLPSILNALPYQAPTKGLINKAKRFVDGATLPKAWQHLRWDICLTPYDKATLYHDDLAKNKGPQPALAHMRPLFSQFDHPDSLATYQYIDVKTSFSDDVAPMLARMSAINGVDARLPFLDYRVVEHALSLPAHLKMQKGRRNLALQKMMQNHLPEHLFSQPHQALRLPLKELLRWECRSLMLDLLSPDTVRRRGYFKPEVVTRWIQEHLSLQINHSHRIWALMSLELWYQQFVDAIKVTPYVETRPISINSPSI